MEDKVKFYSKNPRHMLFLPNPDKRKPQIKVEFKPVGDRTGRTGFGFLVTDDPSVISGIKGHKKLYGENKAIHENPKWLLKKGTTEAFEVYGRNKAMESEEVKEKIDAKAKEIAQAEIEKATIATQQKLQESEQEKAKAAEERKVLVNELNKLAGQILTTDGSYRPGSTKEDRNRYEELQKLIIG